MSKRSKVLPRNVASAMLLVCAFMATTYAATMDRIAAKINNQHVVALGQKVHPLAQAKYDQGRIDPGTRISGIMLQTVPTASQRAALAKLLVDQQNPKSANYHKWLTPEQWADRFGLSQADVQKVTAWLKSQGFTGIQVARGRNWFLFNGTAAQIESTFATEIHHYNVKGEMHFANASSPRIPAALTGIVAGLRGLDNFQLKPRIKPRAAFIDTSLGNEQFLAPGDIATMYDINALYSATTPIDGTGEKLAIIGQTDIFINDINEFRGNFGLSQITCTNDSTSGLVTACSDSHFQYDLVLATGVTDPLAPSINDITEADIDLEWSGAVAKNAQIVYVNAPVNATSGGGVSTAWYYAVDNDVAPVISMSYGTCEFFITAPGGASGSADEMELQQANTEGITFLSSTGDSGVAACDPNGIDTSGASATGGEEVSYPASSPEVTAVGGTAIPLANFGATYWNQTTNGADGGSILAPPAGPGYIPEQAYNDDDEIAQFCVANPSNTYCTQGGSPAVAGWVSIGTAGSPVKTTQEDLAIGSPSGITSGGGGPSNCAMQDPTGSTCLGGFPQPSWQTVTVSGQAAARFLPDVALLASPDYPGYIFCTPQEAWGGTGGTTTSTCAGGLTGATGALDSWASFAGGTSVSTPVFAGIVTLLNQYLAGPSSPGLGNINPTLYSLAGSSVAFHDVTAGDNNVYCTAGDPSGRGVPVCPGAGVFGFSAGTGYDLATGLGSVDADELAMAWGSARTASSISISASAPQITAGKNVTFTATVSPTTATGNVSFFLNGSTSAFASQALTSTGNGVVTASSTTLPLGSDTVTATYNGDGSNAPATTSPGASVNVQATGTFTLKSNLGASGAGTLSVAQGATGTVNLTVQSSNGFVTGTAPNQQTALPVTYTCTGLPSETTCQITPNSTTRSITPTVKITTTAPTHSMLQRENGSRILYAALLPGLFGVVFVAGSRKRSMAGLRVLGLIMVLGASAMWVGCGGSNNSSTSNLGTPVGNYTVTISGTTSNSSINSNYKFTLTVTNQ